MEEFALRKKILLVFLVGLAVIGIFLFLPAGTLGYWQAWAYITVTFIPAFFVVFYFLKRDPEFLERRMKFKEKEEKQKLIVGSASAFFIISFLIPGLDHRFGWSNIPTEVSIIADAFVLLGYAICFLAFKENSYAARVVEVTKGQKVITTGLYSVVRHPMYVGVIILYLASPFALGSYFAFFPFLLIVPIIIYRALNEEEVLLRDLNGYKEYCQKTRYRLIPFVW